MAALAMGWREVICVFLRMLVVSPPTVQNREVPYDRSTSAIF